MTEEQAADIQEHIYVFMEARGGYVASASERELFRLLASYGDARAAQERTRCAQLAHIVGTAHTYSAAEQASGFAASDIVVRIVAALSQPGV